MLYSNGLPKNSEQADKLGAVLSPFPLAPVAVPVLKFAPVTARYPPARDSLIGSPRHRPPAR